MQCKLLCWHFFFKCLCVLFSLFFFSIQHHTVLWPKRSWSPFTAYKYNIVFPPNRDTAAWGTFYKYRLTGYTAFRLLCGFPHLAQCKSLCVWAALRDHLWAPASLWFHLPSPFEKCRGLREDLEGQSSVRGAASIQSSGTSRDPALATAQNKFKQSYFARTWAKLVKLHQL